MRVDAIARKARLEALSAERDICTLLFDHTKPKHACRVFLMWLKNNGGRASPQEISRFARDLGEGSADRSFRYSRNSFYRTVRRRLVDLGFLELYYGWHGDRRQWVYAPVLQPIPLRPPGGRNFYHMAWQICERWNREWRR